MKLLNTPTYQGLNVCDIEPKAHFSVHVKKSCLFYDCGIMNAEYRKSKTPDNALGWIAENEKFGHARFYGAADFFYVPELDRSFPKIYAREILNEKTKKPKGVRFVILDPESFRLYNGVEHYSFEQ